jgi:SPX domain protein involved in polyphosphate accumulation
LANSPFIKSRALEKVEEEDGSLSFSSPSMRRRKTLNTPKKRIEELIAKFSTAIHKETEMIKRNKKEDKSFGSLRIEELSDDDGDPGQNDKGAADAASINRALVDQYRSAKLLHNFAILNYTGFVKIVKKYEKTLPDRKGRLKGALEPQNLFNEGKAIDSLATKFEQYYANWFCEGDIRAAHAQMLPKRGDFLEMDWSQLR